jgi:broad specificity phosphatase PhoE
MKILFVRHGKSIANANATIGEPATLLAEEGLEQARVTGEDLKNQNVTAIICSSYIRAQQTAEIIAGVLGIPIHDIQVVEELHERRMGELEGKPKLHPTEFFYQNDKELGFEPQNDLIARMKVALGKVKQIAEATSGTTVLVGHATSGFYFLQVAQGKEKFEDFDPVNQMGNAEFIEVKLAS